MVNQVKGSGQNTRVAYLDCIRAVAAFAVVMLHVSAQNWYSVGISSPEWKVFHCCDSAVRWAVPLFVMVSGAVFLNRDIPVKRIFTKYIPRLLAAFAFWSLIYAVYEGGGLETIRMNFVKGSFHMWYIPMLIGLYLCIPIYSKIVEHDGVVQYFLGVSLLIAFLIPQAVSLAKDFGSEAVVSFVSWIEPHWKNVKSPMMLGYSAYFVLGYYLNKAELSGKQRRILYLLGFVSYFLTVIATDLASQRTASHNDHYYSEYTLNTFLQAAAVFVFFKQHGKSGTMLHKICVPISEASFGIYWIHMLVMNLLDEKMMVNTLSCSAVISVPVLILVVFTLSFALSWLIGRIPVFKRYLV